MNQHAWISAVFDDMIDYALRNDLAELRRELARTATRIAPLLDDDRTADPVGGVCDVIRMPARQA